MFVKSEISPVPGRESIRFLNALLAAAIPHVSVVASRTSCLRFHFVVQFVIRSMHGVVSSHGFVSGCTSLEYFSLVKNVLNNKYHNNKAAIFYSNLI